MAHVGQKLALGPVGGFRILLGFPELLFGKSAFGDILDGTGIASASIGKDRLRVNMYPFDLAIGSNDAAIRGKGVHLLKGVFPFLRHTVSIVFV